jgi:GH24 family phage-related lysozyme (muramidase)
MIKEGEGCIPHMYLDTKGLVTVAVGQLLRTVDAAHELDFVCRDTGEPAAAAEITRDYESVERQSAGRVASFYKQFTKLDLPKPAIDALLDKRIEGFEAGLRADFPDYDSCPVDAKLGLMDMVFNLGNAGLVSKFPTFTRAARKMDWATCAQECRRKGISDQRNSETKRLFEDAAAPGDG